ncbi:MAG: hypothetical protein MUC98_18990 [Desulfobacterota bacterium]|nr:hypothetical protein [Thermodesulfobacteriota bacterium]
MKPCPDRYETMMLAAYGELNPEQQRDWNQHTAACPGCRKEYDGLVRLLGQIKESMPVPKLSESKASDLLRAVKQELRKERQKRSWWKEWLARPNRLVPALATASVVLITFGLFGPNFTEKPSPPKTDVENEAVIQNLDVLTNLDFLEEMDTLQELLNVLDRNEPT